MVPSCRQIGPAGRTKTSHGSQALLCQLPMVTAQLAQSPHHGGGQALELLVEWRMPGIVGQWMVPTIWFGIINRSVERKTDKRVSALIPQVTRPVLGLGWHSADDEEEAIAASTRL